MAEHQVFYSDTVFRCSTEDAAGNLWFGSDNGLYRYENGNWTLFNSANNFPGSNVKALCSDPHGPVWVVTDNGVSRFDGEWRHWGIWINPNNSVEHFGIDKSGRFWLGGDDALYCFDGTSYAPVILDGVLNLAIAPDGTVWTETRNFNTIYRITGTEAEHIRSNSRNAWNMTLDAQGALWLTYVDEVHTFDGTAWTRFTLQDGIPFDAQGIAFNNDGTPWCYAKTAVSKYSGGKWTTTALPVSWGVFAVRTDGSGHVFFITRTEGIFVWDGTSMQHYAVPGGYSGAFCSDNDGRFWVTNGTRFNLFENGTWISYQNDSLITPWWWSYVVFFDMDENLWFSSVDGGLVRCWDLSSAPLQVEDSHSPAITAFTCTRPYPNPFNSSAAISVFVPGDTMVNLSIYTVDGKHIATLLDGAITRGTHQVRFDGTSFPSGLYFYRLESGSQVETGKMMLVK
jgi:ligand-binding sensor domain-containing protein